MREIKFRAWDYERKEMIQPESIIGLEGETTKQLVLSAPFLTLMQFTGLHDKNGKEIYEGDIVSMVRDVRINTKRENKRRGYSTYAVTEKQTISGIVKIGLFNHYFSTAMMVYVEVKKDTSWPSYFYGEGKRSDKPTMVQENLSEVMETGKEYEWIGNIYENPELLGGVI